MKSIQTKILLFFSIFFVSAVSLIGLIMFSNAKDLVEQSVGDQAKSIAESAAKVIDGEKFERIIIGEETDYYFELRNTLNNIRETNGLLYLYTMTKRDSVQGDEYIYVVDGLPLDDEDASGFGDVEEIEDFPIIVDVFKSGEAMVGELITTEEYGSLIYAYAPIINQSGQVIGLVGADFDANKVAEQLAVKRITAILVTIGVSLISIIILFILTKFLIRPLKKLTRQVEQVKEGDLTVIIETNRTDEIGSLALSFQHMVDEMNEMINSINKNTIMLTETSGKLADNFHHTVSKNEQIVSGMYVVSDGAKATVRNSEESSRAMEDLTQGVQHIAETALQVSDASHATVEDANLGMKALEQVSMQMNSIHEAVEESAELVKNLDQYSVEIGKIVDVISIIASQTNLLALNAAIEAARAGENGKGFAVVADEVRKLAEQTSHSLNDISQIVQKIQNETTKSVQAMEEMSVEVDTGVVVIQKSGDAFKKIKDSAHYVVNQVDLFTSTAEQMSAGAQEVNASFEEMASIAKRAAEQISEVAASIENQSEEMTEISSFAERLMNMVNELQKHVSKFKID